MSYTVDLCLSCLKIFPTYVQVYPRSLDGFKMRPATTAVEGISIAIPTGECFGLLGVNGIVAIVHVHIVVKTCKVCHTTLLLKYVRCVTAQAVKTCKVCHTTLLLKCVRSLLKQLKCVRYVMVLYC